MQNHGPELTPRGPCVWNENRGQTQHAPCCTIAGVYMLADKTVLVVCACLWVTTKMLRSIDFEVTNQFWQVDKFTNVGSMNNEDRVYIVDDLSIGICNVNVGRIRALVDFLRHKMVFLSHYVERKWPPQSPGFPKPLCQEPVLTGLLDALRWCGS